MKKQAVPSYLARTKWFVFALIALILIVFGRTVETPSLTKSAVVLGIGIDYKEDTSLFTVSAQCVLVGSSSGDTSETTFNTYSSSGNTISGAMDGIARKMGLIISLAHCNVVVMSQSALTLDHLQLIYPLTGMYALPEQTIIVSCPDSPEKLLSLRMGTTLSAPFFLQQALINEEGSDGMIRTTSKDFLARSLSRSEANAVPYIKVQKAQSPPISQQGDDKNTYELLIGDALVFNHDKFAVIDKEYAEVLALFLGHGVTGTFNYTDENGGSMEFKVLKKDVKLKANGRNVKAEIALSVDLSDVQNVNTNEVLSSADDIVKRYAQKLANEIKAKFEYLYEFSKKENIDFLNLQAKAYQSVGRTLEKDCLSTITFTPIVKINVRETG